MRISDWSSDVCSSDRSPWRRPANLLRGLLRIAAGGGLFRSEEHTSELQSLMRISYAVFCLKKKNTPNETPTAPQPTHKLLQQRVHYYNINRKPNRQSTQQRLN